MAMVMSWNKCSLDFHGTHVIMIYNGDGIVMVLIIADLLNVLFFAIAMLSFNQQTCGFNNYWTWCSNVF